MKDKDVTVRKRARVTEAAKGLLSEPVVLPTEDVEDYDRLAREITKAINPKDFIERIWVQDILDHTWEIRRLRRLKVHLVELMDAKGLRVPIGLLAPRLKDVDKQRQEELRVANTLIANLATYQIIDALLMVAESSRAITFREIERRRHGLAALLRKVSEEIIEGEFTEPPPHDEATA